MSAAMVIGAQIGLEFENDGATCAWLLEKCFWSDCRAGFHGRDGGDDLRIRSACVVALVSVCLEG
jgi:hypothetical protein